MELKATSSLMHGVLTPVQSAMVRAILYLLLYSDDSKMRSFADINRFFHSIIVDDQMSRCSSLGIWWLFSRQSALNASVDLGH